MGPLKGLRILEIAGIGPAPFCAMMLGDMGAEVVRIDRPNVSSVGGDPNVNVNNRSRRSVALDLKTHEGCQAALKLAGQADALIEGFRPGVMERLGLGPDICLERNSRLVFGRMTGWGQDGPLADSAGHDINYLAITGALHAIGTKDSGPVPPLNIVADFGGGGMMLLVGILAAIMEAKASGKGQVVDAAMSDGVPLLMGSIYSRMAQGQWTDAREANELDGGAYYYGTYECSDGKWISLGPIEPQFYRLLMEKIGLLDDPVFQIQDDRSNWLTAKVRLAEIVKSKTRDEWDKIFHGTDVCYGPVLSLKEAPNHPHNKHRNAFIEIGGYLQSAPAPRFSRTPQDIPTPPPWPGQHNDEVLQDWGFSIDELTVLRNANALKD
ncbi:MAG: carnitine dehydratase [Rhodospirillaceae bacterium TMED8]|nr:carnitine dehydratase [Magnetovibrio sp.]OUT48316.1 MAG: carnitine dehydratase [Rhodospirillaceae bacterium TMED8]